MLTAGLNAFCNFSQWLRATAVSQVGLTPRLPGGLYVTLNGANKLANERGC